MDGNGTTIIKEHGGDMNSMMPFLLVVLLLAGGGNLLGGNRNNDVAQQSTMATGFQGVQNSFDTAATAQTLAALGKDLSAGMNYLSDKMNTNSQFISQDLNAIRAEVGSLGVATIGAVKDAQYANALAQKDIQFTTQAGFAAVAAQNAACCCETQRGIDGVNFNMANQFANTNSVIKDGFCQTNFANERNTNAIIQSNAANTQRIMDWLSCNELKEAQTKIAELNQQLNTQTVVNAVTSNLQPPRAIPAYAVPNPFVPFGAGCGGAVAFGGYNYPGNCCA